MENEQKPKVTITLPEATQVASDRITITWNYEIEGAPEDSVSFEVFLKGEKADGSPFDRVAAQERNKCTLTGLKGETTYSLFVVAVHEGEDIAQFPDDDEGVVVTTPKRAPLLDWKKIAICAGALAVIALVVLLATRPKKDNVPPTADNVELTVTDKTSYGFTLGWEGASDKVTPKDSILYKVWLGSAAEPMRVVCEGQGITSYQATGLKGGELYTVSVEAFDQQGNKFAYPTCDIQLDAVIEDKVEALPTLRVKDRRLKVSNVSSHSFTIEWERAEDGVTPPDKIPYRVFFKPTKNVNSDWSFVNAVGQSKYILTDLQPQTKYSFRVVAYAREGGQEIVYEDSSVMTLKKVNDNQPPTAGDQTLKVSGVNSDGFTVTWERAKDNVSPQDKIEYTVYLAGFNRGASKVATVDTGINSYTFTGLKPDIPYTVGIYAMDEAGNNVYLYQIPHENPVYVPSPDGVKTVLSKPEDVLCNGIYVHSNNGANAKGLQEYLGDMFDRDYFEISFDYLILKGVNDSQQFDNIITLDTSHRIFSLVMEGDKILAKTWNGDHSFETPIHVAYNVWLHAALVYNNGILSINGSDIPIGKLDDIGDNTITTTNYSNGHCFNGHIKNLVVRSREKRKK